MPDESRSVGPRAAASDARPASRSEDESVNVRICPDPSASATCKLSPSEKSATRAGTIGAPVPSDGAIMKGPEKCMQGSELPLVYTLKPSVQPAVSLAPIGADW